MVNPTLKVLKGTCFCGIHRISNLDGDAKKKRIDPVATSVGSQRRDDQIVANAKSLNICARVLMN